MRLYHVSFHTDGIKNKRFVPRVPMSAGDGEDKEIKRVCLGPSIEKCVQAIGSCNRSLYAGSVFTVYQAEIDLASKNLLKPSELYQTGMVPDNLENEEYWYLAEIVMAGQQYKIIDFDGCCDIAWSCVKRCDVVQILRQLLNKESTEVQQAVAPLFCENQTSFELYNAVARCAEKLRAYDFVDKLWDEIAELPWAQKYMISKINCISCSSIMSCFE